MPEGQQNQQNQQPTMPPYYVPKKKKTNWWIPVIVIAVILGGFILFFAFIFGSLASGFSTAFEQEKIEVKPNTVLVINLENLQEYSQNNPLSFLADEPEKTSYYEMTMAIERAASDDNIVGILYENTTGGFVKQTGILKALNNFKNASDKFVYAYFEQAGEGSYYDGSAADSIFLAEEGLMGLNGYGASVLFMKGFYDWIGMDFMVIGHEDFKSAGEINSRKSFSDSARYQLEVMLSQRYDYFLDEIAKNRNIERNKIVNLLAKGIYSNDSLLHYGFVDGFYYKNQLKDKIKTEVLGPDSDDDMEYLSLKKYAASEPPIKGEVADSKTKMAIIYGVGPILPGKSDSSPFASGQEIRSEEFCKYISKAREDNEIKAILLRIDSPGGSVTASDMIRQEILKTRKVKPVYCSMSDVAASGGYYIAMSCDTIIAHPQTLTGSIGVISSIPNFSGLIDNLHLNVDTISTTPAAQDLNLMLPFNKEQYNRAYSISKGIYFRFVEKAAESRGMSFDEMRALAKGRVWTGKDAYDRGLVDILGDYNTALAVTKRRMGIDSATKVYVKVYPQPEDDLKALLKMFGLNDTKLKPDFSEASKLLGKSNTEILMLWEAMPENIRQQFLRSLSLIKLSQKEQTLMYMPYEITYE